MSAPLPRLQFGDILLKDQGSPFNWFTKLKTWSEVSHCELYIGHLLGNVDSLLNNMAGGPFVITAFPKGGVAYWPFTEEGLCYVLRPKELLHLAGLRWFETEALGQEYDLTGFLSFFLSQMQGADCGSQFCSELVARIYKKAGQALLHPRVDCDTYAPGSFLLSPSCDIIWAKEGMKFWIEGSEG